VLAGQRVERPVEPAAQAVEDAELEHAVELVLSEHGPLEAEAA
jgi:hypothetical protein